MEGDTPSFLHVTPNGLNDPTVCSQAGWGGYFRWGLSPDSLTTCYTNADPAVRCISEKSVGQETPPDVLKTGNTLAISDISLIFAPCKQ